MHAARLHDRLGGVAMAYKFSRKRYADRFARVFAVDAANRKQLLGWGVPDERISIVGNLAIDGALGEAEGRFGDPDSDAVRDGILLMPGSRKFEIENMLPMFVRIALQIRRRLPDVPIGIARSPFTTDEELARALAAGGVREAYGYPARLEAGGAAILAGGERFPLLAAAMRAARHARLAVMPLNRPELIVINGVLQYVGRLPLVGVPAKRAAIAAGHKRFRFVAQPNIDAERELIPEIRGTLLPSHVAHVAAERFADVEWLAQTGAALRALYAGHAGVAGRMAGVLLEDAAR